MLKLCQVFLLVVTLVFIQSSSWAGNDVLNHNIAKKYYVQLLSGVTAIHKSPVGVNICISLSASSQTSANLSAKYGNVIIGVLKYLNETIGLKFHLNIGISNECFAAFVFTDNIQHLKKFGEILSFGRKAETEKEMLKRLGKELEISGKQTLKYRLFLKDEMGKDKIHKVIFINSMLGLETEDELKNLAFRNIFLSLLTGLSERGNNEVSVFSEPDNIITSLTPLDLALLKYVYIEKSDTKKVEITSDLIQGLTEFAIKENRLLQAKYKANKT